MLWNFNSEQLTNYPYIVIDDNQESILETRAMVSRFRNLHFAGSASNYEDGINLILEFNPRIVFLEIDPEDQQSNLSLKLIDELHRYLRVVPKVIVTTKTREFAFEAIKYEVCDYLIKPLEMSEVRKSILKFERTAGDILQSFESPVPVVAKMPEVIAEELPIAAANGLMLPIAETDREFIEQSQEVSNVAEKVENKPLTICVKSYGDYRFINADDICYLQADNNSTDIHLNNGEMITAFKTLKHFENVLHSPFVRIHNSYIVNIDYVSRIHTGNAVCYIKNTTTKLPFSKSYKENIDAILNSITKGNYLEI